MSKCVQVMGVRPLAPPLLLRANPEAVWELDDEIGTDSPSVQHPPPKAFEYTFAATLSPTRTPTPSWLYQATDRPPTHYTAPQPRTSYPIGL